LLSSRSLAHISGLVFFDANANAVFDSSEGGVREGVLLLTAPDGTSTRTHPIDRVTLRSAPGEVGMYRLALEGPFTSGGCESRPQNPIEVLLPPGPHGLPQSYERALFGIARGPALPGTPVIITDLSPHEIVPQDRYRLLSARCAGTSCSSMVGSAMRADQPVRALCIEGVPELVTRPDLGAALS